MGIGDCTPSRILVVLTAMSLWTSAVVNASIVPFSENFEGFTNGDDINGTSGWLAAPNVATASNEEANGGRRDRHDRN